MTTAELLAARRPHRADAARNFDAILEAAANAFDEDGPQVPLEAIAERAGVGVATLYRNFPTRGDLVESVYVAEVDSLCRFGEGLQEREAWDALVAWVGRFVAAMATKRALLDVLDRDSGAFRACRDALYASGGPLLERAQADCGARRDVDIDDVMRFVLGVSGAPVASEAQRDRIVGMAIDGMHA